MIVYAIKLTINLNIQPINKTEFNKVYHNCFINNVFHMQGTPYCLQSIFKHIVHTSSIQSIVMHDEYLGNQSTSSNYQPKYKTI